MAQVIRGEGILIRGEVHDPELLECIGWTAGDGSGHEGYSCWDYFDGEGQYLGPDQSGIEPMFEQVLCIWVNCPHPATDRSGECGAVHCETCLIPNGECACDRQN